MILLYLLNQLKKKEMGTLITMAIIIIGVIIWGVFSVVGSGKEQTKNEGAFNQVLRDKNLTPDHIIFTRHNNCKNCLSINDNHKKISFGFFQNGRPDTKEFNYDDIVSFEIQENNQTSYKASIGGAIIGGAVAGGVGAIIGGQRNPKTKIIDIRFIIVVNDIISPMIKFSLLPSTSDGKGWAHDSFIVSNAQQNAEKWKSIFQVVLKQQ